MKLIPVEEIPNIEIKRHHYLEELVKEFVNSSYDTCEVNITDRDYKQPVYCYKGIWCAIKRLGLTEVKTVFRNGKTYLVRVKI